MDPFVDPFVDPFARPFWNDDIAIATLKKKSHGLKGRSGNHAGKAVEFSLFGYTTVTLPVLSPFFCQILFGCLFKFWSWWNSLIAGLLEFDPSLTSRSSLGVENIMIQFKHGKTTEEVGFHLLQCCFSIRTLTLTHPVIFCGAPIHKTNPWPMPTKRPIAVPLWPRIGSHECPPTSRIAASWASGPDIHVASESSERTYVHTSRYTWYVKYSVYIYYGCMSACVCLILGIQV